MQQCGLWKAIKYFGSQTALATAIGVKQQTISNWLNREHSIPYTQVLKIVKATKGSVTIQELAPFENEMNHTLKDIMKIFSNLHHCTLDKLTTFIGS